MEYKTILINKFPVELHKAVRVYAAQSGLKVTDIYEQAVREFLKNNSSARR